MYHIFLNQSSAGRHLSWFLVLAVINSAAMNIGVHVSFRISSVQSLSHVRLFSSPWTASRQASLSWSLLKPMSIELVMPSNHLLILCCPLLLLPSIFPSIRVFSNESVLRIRGQSIGVWASASVLPMNIWRDWKGRVPHPIICGHASIGLCGGIHLRKKLHVHTSWGGSMDHQEERNKITGQR